MSEFYLFFDLETTGLDPHALTVLEAAWTFTGSDLRQRTPLRSRLCGIATDDVPATVPVLSGGYAGWSREISHKVVQDMHRDSRLHRDWLDAPEFSILRTVEDLDRLLFDDLARSGWRKGDVVHLAGAGISHFDRPVLDALLSKFAVAPSPVLHYRAADVSSAVTLLGIASPKTGEDLSSLAIRVAERKSHPFSVASFRELLTDESTSVLQRWGTDQEDTGQMNSANLVPHRAAPDVAFSLMLARILRACAWQPEPVAAV